MLQTSQIWTNDDQMPILCLSYFITSVTTPLLKQTHNDNYTIKVILMQALMQLFFVTDHVDGLH